MPERKRPHDKCGEQAHDDQEVEAVRMSIKTRCSSGVCISTVDDCLEVGQKKAIRSEMSRGFPRFSPVIGGALLGRLKPDIAEKPKLGLGAQDGGTGHAMVDSIRHRTYDFADS